MTDLNFATQFDYPQTPSSLAWCIAVAVIGHADFSQPTLTYELNIERLLAYADRIPYSWLQEALGSAMRFSLAVYESANFEESDFDSLSMFLNMGYRADPSRIIVELNPSSLPYLQQLQAGISELYEKNKLQPARLTKHMRALAPLVVFDMKKGQRYSGLNAMLLAVNNVSGLTH